MPSLEIKVRHVTTACMARVEVPPPTIPAGVAEYLIRPIDPPWTALRSLHQTQESKYQVRPNPWASFLPSLPQGVFFSAREIVLDLAGQI